MTTETLTEAPLYTILTTGPYAIPHAWSRAGDLVVEVRDADGTTLRLDPPDWSVSPAVSSTGGDLTLAGPVAGAHHGKQLLITRETLVEQGWAGHAAREVGLEGEIDRTARAVQDLRALSDRMPRLPRGTAVARPQLPEPAAGRVLIGRDDDRGWETGPSADDISDARQNAEAAALSAAQAALYEGVWLNDVQALIGDTALTYAPGFPGTVVPEQTVVRTRKEGFSYVAASPAASDADIATAGGAGGAVKLYALPGADGFVTTMQVGCRANDATETGDDDGPIIAALYARHRRILWEPGFYRIGSFIHVREGTETVFADGTVIHKDSATHSLFSNAPMGEDQITGYNGEGRISFLGPVCMTSRSTSTMRLRPFNFVHAEHIVIDGGPKKAVVHDGVTGHIIEMNACRNWRVSNYIFRDIESRNAASGSENSEVIQWDGAFDGASPETPGAIDGTTCASFEISDCEFYGIATAFGTHSSGTGERHRDGRMYRNHIENAVHDGVRIMNLVGGVMRDCVIVGGTPTRRSLIVRRCEGVTVEYCRITDGQSAAAGVIQFNNSRNCAVIKTIVDYSSAPTYVIPVQVASSGTPSKGCSIDTSLMMPGTDADRTLVHMSANVLAEINGITELWAGRTANTNDVLQLLDDLNGYKYILVSHGSVSANTYMTSPIFPFLPSTGFRPGTDNYQIAGADGAIMLEVSAPDELKIISASNDIRRVLGVARRRAY